jgi:hypothetical protein
LQQFFAFLGVSEEQRKRIRIYCDNVHNLGKGLKQRCKKFGALGLQGRPPPAQAPANGFHPVPSLRNHTARDALNVT